MKKTLMIVCALLCLAGIVLIAGCTSGPAPEGTPAPTETTTPTGTTPAETTPAEATPSGETDIYRTLNAMPEYSVLRELLLLADLDQTLATGGPYTLFAPDNSAFAGLEGDAKNRIRADPEGLLTPVLLYHVVEGEYTAADLQGMTSLETVEGSMLTITLSGGEVMVGDAVVVEPDIMATNGVIHGIDQVLVPSGVTIPTAEPTTAATTEATPQETVNQT